MSRTIGHGPPGTRGREIWARERRRTLIAENPWLRDLDLEIGGQALKVACWVLDPRLPCPPETWRRALALTLNVAEPTPAERKRFDSAAAYARRTGDPAGLLGAARWAPLHSRAWEAVSAQLAAAGCADWTSHGAWRVARHRAKRGRHPTRR